MTEQVEQEIVEQQEQVPEQVPELSPIEQKALEMGWRPKSEFTGAEEEFIDAKEFVGRKPLYDRLEQTGKQLKQVNKTLDQLKTHYTKMREVEFNRALSQLKAARDQAVTDSDGARFSAIDDRIKEVEREAAQVLEEEHEQEVPEPNIAEFQDWRSKNSWYQKDEAMTAYADKVGLRFQSGVASGELTPLQVLKQVEKAVRTEFPHKFKNVNKETAPNVGEGKTPAKVEAKFELSETEQKIMNNLVRSKIMTKEEYMNDLRKAKGIV